MLIDFDGPLRVQEAGEPRASRPVRFPALGWGVLAGLAAYGAWGLSTPRAELRVASEPAGAVVVIDDWFISETPAVQRLRKGRHKLVVRAPGFDPQVLSVELGTEPLALQAVLKPRVLLGRAGNAHHRNDAQH